MTQPHNPDTERAVLAVLLAGAQPTAIMSVREILRHPLCFWIQHHQIIYQAALDLDDAGERIDATSISGLLHQTASQGMVDRLQAQAALLDAGRLDKFDRQRLRGLWKRRKEDESSAYADSALARIGGFSTLTDLAMAFAPLASINRNALTILDLHQKRRLIGMAERLANRARQTTDTATQLVDQAGQDLLELGSAEASEIHGMEAVTADTLAAIAEARDAPSGLVTGFTAVDEVLMSLRPGGLYILAARPGVGKTSFALNIVEKLARAHRCLFFSLEVDRLDLLKKLFCGAAGIPFRDLESGRLDHDQQMALEKSAKEMKNIQLDLIDLSDLTVTKLRSIARRHMIETKRELKLIVIDYLQLLGSSRPDMSEYEKVSEISRTLKILARELRIPVLALSQLSREGERGTVPREPRLADLRGSGSIEQDADAVMFLHRTDAEVPGERKDMRDILLSVAKNRFGPTGAVPMVFIPGRQRFEERPAIEVAPSGYGMREPSAADNPFV